MEGYSRSRLLTMTGVSFVLDAQEYKYLPFFELINMILFMRSGKYNTIAKRLARIDEFRTGKVEDLLSKVETIDTSYTVGLLALDTIKVRRKAWFYGNYLWVFRK